jgi:hypothetical protein
MFPEPAWDGFFGVKWVIGFNNFLTDLSYFFIILSVGSMAV